jgi:hypothetical protein
MMQKLFASVLVLFAVLLAPGAAASNNVRGVKDKDVEDMNKEELIEYRRQLAETLLKVDSKLDVDFDHQEEGDEQQRRELMRWHTGNGNSNWKPQLAHAVGHVRSIPPYDNARQFWQHFLSLQAKPLSKLVDAAEADYIVTDPDQLRIVLTLIEPLLSSSIKRNLKNQELEIMQMRFAFDEFIQEEIINGVLSSLTQEQLGFRDLDLLKAELSALFQIWTNLQ